MLKKRIIPCLDIQNGRTVKGVNFVDIRDAGDPVVLARKYAENGADELVFLDITATHEGRKTTYDMVQQVAREINIPFTVGGGISSVEDAAQLLNCGADKISINSSAIKNPQLLVDLSDRFGNQCVVLAIDARFTNGKWKVFTHGGRNETELELISWAKKGVELGAGEILFTSMDHDGTKNGFAIEVLNQLANEVNVPIIASGGCGSKEHFRALFENSNADAGLAASVFHFGEIEIKDLKAELNKYNIPVRC